MSTDTLRLSDRTRHIGLSATMKGTIEAERLRRQGIDVVDLGAGEPDFPTPAHITAAAHSALDDNFTKYTANPGVTELREAVAFRCQQDHGVSFQSSEVIITAGGKQALHHASLALFGPGDEVITHAPGWPTLTSRRSSPARRRSSCARTKRMAFSSAPRRSSPRSPRARAGS